MGSRFLDNKIRINKYFRTKIANKFLSILFSKVNKVNCTDVATCYKLLESKHLSKLDLEQNDFSIEVEILSKFLSMGLTLKEHPISYEGRTYEEGKKIGLSDGFKYIMTIFKYDSELNLLQISYSNKLNFRSTILYNFFIYFLPIYGILLKILSFLASLYVE